jgi:hypothetical protein
MALPCIQIVLQIAVQVFNTVQQVVNERHWEEFMKIRYILPLSVVATLSVLSFCWGQGVLSHSPNASMNPCPGGTVFFQPDVESPTSLDALVKVSDLIVVGTVSKLMPAVAPLPDHLQSIHTDSLITVDNVLRGSLPANTTTIAISQMGGTVPPCTLKVPDDPLVKPNERYILFLRADSRTVPANTTGVPRYGVVGLWSGKVQVINGTVQFLPKANARLHKYDNTSVADFITAIREVSAALLPPK